MPSSPPGLSDMGHNLRILCCLRSLPRGPATTWIGMTRHGMELCVDGSHRRPLRSHRIHKDIGGPAPTTAGGLCQMSQSAPRTSRPCRSWPPLCRSGKQTRGTKPPRVLLGHCSACWGMRQLRDLVPRGGMTAPAAGMRIQRQKRGIIGFSWSQGAFYCTVSGPSSPHVARCVGVYS